MRGFKRTGTLEFLVEHGPRWTRKWEKRRESQKVWHWPKFQGKSVQQWLAEALGPLTQELCSYCDAGQLGAASHKTIDHFRPKIKFPSQAFDWANLFLCCNACNSAKGEQWTENWIKPDEPGYEFSRFFWYVSGTGELIPHPKSSPSDQARAQATIDGLKLNKAERCTARKNECKKMNGLKRESQPDLLPDDFSYRFLSSFIQEDPPCLA